MYRKSPQNKGQIDALPSSDGGATIEEKRLLWKGYSNEFNVMRFQYHAFVWRYAGFCFQLYEKVNLLLKCNISLKQ